MNIDPDIEEYSQPRIVILAPFGLYPKATLSSRALPLLTPLLHMGYSIHVLAPSDLWPQDAGKTIEIDGITVEHAPLATRHGPLGMLQTTKWMYNRTLALRPDVVHLFKPKGYGALAMVALHKLHPELPLMLDTDDWEGRGGWNDRLMYPTYIKVLIDWLEQYLPSRMDGVTVASRMLEAQVGLFEAKHKNVLYVPNGVYVPGRQLPSRTEARQFLQLDDQPTVLLYTRFWEFDVQDVVACCVGLACQMPQIRVLVLGAGESGEEEHMALYARRAGIEHILDMRGWVDQPTIDAGLAAADVAMYPMNDTLLNRAKCSAKLTEQMQAGLPIVAARVGQVAEYIKHDHSGLLVQPGDAGALAKGILELLNDQARAQKLGSAAKERIEAHFAWEHAAIRLEQAYTKLISIRSKCT